MRISKRLYVHMGMRTDDVGTGLINTWTRMINGVAYDFTVFFFSSGFCSIQVWREGVLAHMFTRPARADG